MNNNSKFWIAGKHTVLEALKNKNNTIYKILLQNSKNLNLVDSVNLNKTQIAKEKEIRSYLNNQDISHQGFLALIERRQKKIELKEIFNENNIIILDNINDQRNIGAIIRTAYAFNIKTIITNKSEINDKSLLLNKTACGVIEKIKIFKVSNVVNIISDLKKNNFWIYCFDNNAKEFFNKKTLNQKNVFVFGSEEKGARSIVKSKCDFILKININPEVESLNVSNSVTSVLTTLNSD